MKCLEPSRLKSLRPAGDARGFSLIEILIAAVLILLAALVGIAYVVRGSQSTDWARDRVFANQKALSILAELRGYAAGPDAEDAGDLDRFHDGDAFLPTLSIRTLPDVPYPLVNPNHPISGNVTQMNSWRWFRSIAVESFGGEHERDRRLVTVRVYRHHIGEDAPGVQMAEVSGVIQSLEDALPGVQVMDLFVIAIDNVPGWWTSADGMKSLVESTVDDLQTRNPGLEFRLHMVTKLGFGRDEDYAPYTNFDGLSTDPTPWAYVYPGTLPDGEGHLQHMAPFHMGGLMNQDGETTPIFENRESNPEPFDDANLNGELDPGESYRDKNENFLHDWGNPVPYTFADMHNHCMRYPDAAEKFQARVDARTEDDDTPTWRLLLDRMILQPGRYHNALILNMHGELLPMPPARNYSDAAKSPAAYPGWRVVTHPELIRPERIAGDDANSDAPRFRVYAWKAAFDNPETFMTEKEPFEDANGNEQYDAGESYSDWNGNGVHDQGLPITLVIPGGDLTSGINIATNPSLIVKRLAGGVDADDDGNVDPYTDWENAPILPEQFTDTNKNGIRERNEPYLDLDGDRVRDSFEPYAELDGNGVWTNGSEVLQDQNGNGIWDQDTPNESFTDDNGNGRWDSAEPYWDLDGNGVWTPPTNPVGGGAGGGGSGKVSDTDNWGSTGWKPAWFGDATKTQNFLTKYGEPFQDLDGDGVFDADPEPFVDANGNGRRDGGFSRGEMFFSAQYDPVGNRTVLTLHGTPLEAPQLASGEGLPATWRLYDYEYVPCPTPKTAASTDRFELDLFEKGDTPKNTARWTVEIPVASIREHLASMSGARDGDSFDRVVSIETRLGTDLTTGVMWPTRNDNQNVSKTYAWFHASPETVPFSERYQFQGDPRHSPYADNDATGWSYPNGYNWYFDDFSAGGGAQSEWLAFDKARLARRWSGGPDFDLPRQLQWLREAVTRSEAVFTSLSGLPFSFVSLGGDIGNAPGSPNEGILMNGLPFGVDGNVRENTLAKLGTKSIRGSRKYVRENNDDNKTLRDGGYWWSKPWIGELFPDNAYTTQWSPWGNLRAATSTNKLEFHQAKRGSITTMQQPEGTVLLDARGELGTLGATSFFNIGEPSRTFHHTDSGKEGRVIQDGFELGGGYGFMLPTKVWMSHPMQLGSGGGKKSSYEEGPEFAFPETYPPFHGAYGPRFFAKDKLQDADQGVATIRLTEPLGQRSARVPVTALWHQTEDGPAFLCRLGILTLLHSFLAEGTLDTVNRIDQLPSIMVVEPTVLTPLVNPMSIRMRWDTDWSRWDERPYTSSYPDDFSQDDSRIVYVLLYSADEGGTWMNMLDDSSAKAGVLPRDATGAVDGKRTLQDVISGGEETYAWRTPIDKIPAGQYLIRFEAYRRGESSHYSYNEERINVAR